MSSFSTSYCALARNQLIITLSASRRSSVRTLETWRKKMRSAKNSPIESSWRCNDPESYPKEPELELLGSMIGIGSFQGYLSLSYWFRRPSQSEWPKWVHWQIRIQGWIRIQGGSGSSKACIRIRNWNHQNPKRAQNPTPDLDPGPES